MARIQVVLGDRSYPIIVESGALGRLGEFVKQALPRARRALIITDTNVSLRYGVAAKLSLEQAGIETNKATVPAGESSKTLAQAYNLYTACINAQLERTSVVVALGGGVVGDLAGFVAATYLRGIPFVQVPTTLLAQVDSSVGGKTGVDLPQGKNLVGAFHQPSLVVADLAALVTLPKREVVAGLAEVVKHAVIRDAGFLQFLEDRIGDLLALTPDVISQVVQTNCSIKGAVVAADEKEGDLRRILNFGHTVGHAVEASMGFDGWLHGECVAVGMVAATAIAAQTGVLQEPELAERLERLLIQLGLPVRLPKGMNLSSLDSLMHVDKKVSDGRIHWVLPVRAGEVTVTPNVSPDIVSRVLESLR